MLVEVKDLTVNPEEAEALRQLNEDGVAVWGSARVGERVRSKIDRAHLQLRDARELAIPSLLVLYDSRDPAVATLSDYQILVAMYGFQAIAIGGARDGQVSFGGGKQMTPKSRDYISGIGVLSNDLTLDIYLNWFARHPLSSVSFPAESQVRVFALPQSPLDGFSHWMRVDVSSDDKST